MAYFDGFVIPVPTGNKDKFIAHAELGDAVFIEQGASRVVESWQDDVAKGHTTDFFGAVAAEDDEAVVFSWIEWPDKASRQAMSDKMAELMANDERFSPKKNPMPFDGKRMIYGGFEPILDLGQPTRGAYVQGFIIPVPAAKKEAYRKMAEDVWPLFQEYGALRVVETWQDEVPEGKQTDFFRAVKAEADERIVFSFLEWPSREVCQAAHDRMQTDDRMQPPPDGEMPFDGKRMVYGGFAPVVELNR